MIIQDFLDKVKKLNTEELSEDDLYKKLQELKAEVEAKNSPYIQDLLARST